jgi:hypothetical protein
MSNDEPKTRGWPVRLVLWTLVLLALAAAVVYLLSDLNRHRFRLTVVDGALVIEQGRFLPAGYEIFNPEAADLKSAYAPLPLPAVGQSVPSEIFTDRVDLDRALFALLSGWIRERLVTKTDADTNLAATYVRRAELLPGLSVEQRQELRRLRADLAYGEGSRLVAETLNQLRRAAEQFKLALELGTSYEADAKTWEQELERRIAALEQLPQGPKPADRATQAPASGAPNDSRPAKGTSAPKPTTP